MENIREAAIKLVNDGYSIIPLRKNKASYLSRWTEFQKRRPTIEEVDGWCEKFGKDMLIAIVTGEISGITVVDVERDGDWEDWPDTVSAKSARGGRHFYYKYDSRVKSPVKFAPLTDLRNDRALIIVPPSVRDEGNYEWLKPLERANLTEFPFDIYQEKAARWHSGLCTEYKGVAEGSRHISMVSRVGTLLRRVPETVWDTEVWVQFQEDNRQNQPPLEDVELRQIFEGISKKECERRLTEPNNITYQTTKAKVEKIVLHTCAEMLATPHQPDSFVIDRLIPEGMVSALTSQAGVGKSIIALEMARCIASGEKFLDRFATKRMPVLLLDQEMSANTIVGRFHSLVNDPGLPIFTSYDTFLKVTKPEDYQKIVDAIKENSIGFVVFDTLVTFHEGNENQVDEMRPVMEAMMRLCSETGVTVLFNHHMRKGAYGEQTSQSSMRGSTEISAKIGSQMTLESKGKTTDETTGETTAKMTLEQHKSRLPVGFKKFEIESIYNEKTLKSQIKYTGDVEEKKPRKEKLKEDIIGALNASASGKLTRQEIIDAVGSQKNADVAIRAMVADGALLEESQPKTKAKLYSMPMIEVEEVEY